MTEALNTNPKRDTRRLTKRVLLVAADPRFGSKLTDILAQAGINTELTQTPDYLAALGAAGTGASPDVVLGDVTDLDGHAAATAAAFRQVAPQAALIAIAAPHQQQAAQAAVAAGFDTWLAQPVSAQQLRSVLFAHPEPPQASPQPAASEQVAAQAESQPLRDPYSLLLAPASRRAADDDSPLGDVDLVQQLMSDRSGLAELAVRLIQQRSGLKDVALVDAASELPAGTVAVPVEHDKSLHGLLVAASGTSPQQLQPWAAWLGQWLALKAHMDQTWEMAFHDQLTGVWNRWYFDRFLGAVLEQASAQRFTVTLLMFDIDDFKRYNDRYGHSAGDEILRETARLMTSVIRAHDVVARIGGDEFGVIFWDHDAPRRPASHHPTEVPQAAERFRQAVCTHKFPKLLDEAPGTLTISGGLASFPWDARTPAELLERADAMLLQSKQQGKNVITFGPGAMQACK